MENCGHPRKKFRRSERILNILKDLIRGEIHPTLLTHEFAKQIVKDILSNGFDLETYRDNNQVSLMDLILGGQVDAIYHPPRVIISILVPIVDKRAFTLYKTHAIENPQRVNNVTAGIAYIRPSHSYLGISNDLQDYFKADQEVLSDCRTSRHSLICPNNLLLQKIENSNDCELNLLLPKNNTYQPSCDVRFKRNSTQTWAHLKYQKQWLFAGNKEEFGIITCERLPTKTETLPEMGILELNDGCTLRTKSITIQGQNKILGTTRYDYKAPMALKVEDLYPSWKMSPDAISHSQNGAQIPTLQWDSEDVSLKEIDDKLLEVARHKRINTYQNYSIWGSFSFTMLIYLAIPIFILYKFKKHPTSPQPPPSVVIPLDIHPPSGTPFEREQTDITSVPKTLVEKNFTARENS